MEDLLTRLLSRPGLQQARMAGAAVRGPYQRSPRDAIAGLASWSGHPNQFVRIASGVGYGVVGQRDRNSLNEILPFVERLANDNDDEVREHGAVSALEQLWLAHADAVSNTIEDWVDQKNDSVRSVVVRAVARIATGGKIGRPSLLKRFIERGVRLYDRMLRRSTGPLRTAIAESIDEMGCMAPDLITPFVLQLAERTDDAALRLVAQIAKLPFGAICHGLDVDAVTERLRSMQSEARKGAADLVRKGDGRVDYMPLFVNQFLVEQQSDHLPWRHVADPYRGCQLRCEFCNARTAAESSGADAKSFVRKVSVVQNAAAVLADELAQDGVLPRHENVVCVGVTSDPYQPSEQRFEITRDILKTCLALEHPVIVQTRQELILRDIDVLEKLAELDLVNVLIAMQSPVEGIRNKIELGTSTVAERFRTMRMLSSKGVPVGLLLSPIMPDLTDDEGLIEETLRRAKDAGASWVVAEVLNLHGSARTKVRLFLDSYISTLLPRYKAIYTAGDRVGDPDPAYESRILDDIVPTLAEKHAINDTTRMLNGGRDPETCLTRR